MLGQTGDATDREGHGFRAISTSIQSVQSRAFFSQAESWTFFFFFFNKTLLFIHNVKFRAQFQWWIFFWILWMCELWFALSELALLNRIIGSDPFAGRGSFAHVFECYGVELHSEGLNASRLCLSINSTAHNGGGHRYSGFRNYSHPSRSLDTKNVQIITIILLIKIYTQASKWAKLWWVVVWGLNTYFFHYIFLTKLPQFLF